jgi:uncharacterized Zn finger protein
MVSCPKCGHNEFFVCHECRKDHYICEECGFVAHKRFWEKDVKLHGKNIKK